MSHFHKLFCKTCNLGTKAVRSTGNIRKFVATWERRKFALAELLDLSFFDVGDIREILRDNSLPSDIYEFLLSHENHELVIRSEYYPDMPDETVLINSYDWAIAT